MIILQQYSISIETGQPCKSPRLTLAHRSDGCLMIGFKNAKMPWSSSNYKILGTSFATLISTCL